MIFFFLQTKNHNWAIYVNPVGVDATVKTQAHRCGAGGYMWNPYYTQLADPLNVRFFSQHIIRSQNNHKNVFIQINTILGRSLQARVWSRSSATLLRWWCFGSTWANRLRRGKKSFCWYKLPTWGCSFGNGKINCYHGQRFQWSKICLC